MKRLLPLVLVLSFGVVSFLFADDPGSAKLAKAWNEYQFQSFDLAAKFFKEALEEGGAAVKLRAKTGLAMVHQFNERAINLDLAEGLYREVLAEGAQGDHGLLITNFLADIHISRGEHEAAVRLLDVLVEKHMDSVIGQDALVRRTVLTMGAYSSPESIEVAEAAEAALERAGFNAERPMLVPLVHSVLADIHFWNEDYLRTAQQTEAFINTGSLETTSYGNRAAQLYRLGRIYELLLNDPANAARFYRRLVEETPNSAMSYFALQRAVALGGFTRAEVEALRISGLTPVLLDEMFSTVEVQD